MKDNTIKITYVDDKIDTAIAIYLSEFCKEQNTAIYNSVKFTSYKIEEFLKLESIKTADILILDSRLYEDANENVIKLTGEELRLFIMKQFPFKQIIIVTQGTPAYENTIGAFLKYQSTSTKSTLEDQVDYYKNLLDDKLSNLIQEVKYTHNALIQAQKNNDNDSLQVEQISNSIEGVEDWRQLTGEDVDELIEQFKELKALINE